VLALAGLAQRLTPFLLLLSVAIPPIAGVYLASYYIAWVRREAQVRRAWRVDSLLAWLAGVAFSGLGISLSGVTAVDSLVVAMAAYVALHFSFFQRGKVE